MANVAKRFGLAALATTLATLYTANVPTAVLRNWDVCNTTAGALTVRLHLVPPGESASAANALLYDTPVAAHQALHWEGAQVLNAGDTLKASASEVGLTLILSGLELS